MKQAEGTGRFSRNSPYEIFYSFVKCNDKSWDVSAVMSKECYDSWLNHRFPKPKSPEESFRRALISHLTGSDGRKPFPCEIEANILKLVRRKQIWDCFKGSKTCNIGMNGFKSVGWHEKLAIRATKTTDRNTPASKSSSSRNRVMDDPEHTIESTSYSIFLKYEKSSADRISDAKRVLSKDCFDSWLASRYTMPRKPAESFRRALISHVAGCDGRKPFPKDVESSLLCELRKKKVWPCFKDTDQNIGIRGFQKLGYHEKQTRALINYENSYETKDDEIESKLNSSITAMQHNRIWTKNIAGFAVRANTHATIDLESNIFGNTKRRLDYEDKSNLVLDFISSGDDNLLKTLAKPGKYQDETCTKKRKGGSRTSSKDATTCNSVSQFFLVDHKQIEAQRCFTELIKTYGRKRLVEILKLHSQDTPLGYVVNHNPDNDLQLQRDFLFPVEDESLFNTFKPIGTVILDQDLIIKKMSMTAANILGGLACLLERDWFVFSASRVQCGILLSNIFSVLEDNNGKSLWFRKSLRRIDGAYRILLNEIKQKEDLFFLAFQDITE
mmetsp:Transcript_19806/g.25314  ORF Transcript_19806/g.25314 Transcript_19806/m.25314 type:complete len:556 (-) Transcript_19806:449-2116(-)